MAEQDERPIPPEGRSRGPIIHSGGEQDIGAPLPPYDELKGEESSGEGFTSQGHEAPPRQVSKEEREGVSPTDTTAASPHGVGVSTTSQGNEEMLGKSEEERRKERQEATYSGVGGSKPIDPSSPNLSPGDQGG